MKGVMVGGPELGPDGRCEWRATFPNEQGRKSGCGTRGLVSIKRLDGDGH